MAAKQRWLLVIAAFAMCGAVLVAIALYYAHQSTEPAPPECQTGPTTRGIDVSYYQETIEWKRVRRAGVLFAFIRVSDGTTVPDSQFAANWDGAHKAGVLRGAYQYFRPDQNATAQADLMIAALRKDRGELPPVIDVETDGGKSPAAIERAVRTWVARVRDRLGVDPIVYTGPDFWTTKVASADLTTQALWLAHYTTNCPTVPLQWREWTFWQFTDRGTVPGIEGPVDLDLFAGTFDDLEAWAARSRALGMGQAAAAATAGRRSAR